MNKSSIEAYKCQLICLSQYLLCLAMSFSSLTVSAGPLPLNHKMVHVVSSDKKTYHFPLLRQVYKEYQTFISGHDPLTISSFQHQPIRREIVEVLFFVKALHLGGCRCRIEFIPSDEPFARSIMQIKNGRMVASPVPGFHGDPRFNSEVHLSNHLHDNKSLFVGLYTSMKRKDLLDDLNQPKIKDLVYAVGEHWKPDILFLESNKLTFVETIDWRSLLGMLSIGRADVVLQPIRPTKDFGFKQFGDYFLPIPKIKVAFPFSRHYIVSRHHPDSADFILFLNRGLEILKNRGEISKGYKAAGVTDHRIKDWKLVDLSH